MTDTRCRWSLCRSLRIHTRSSAGILLVCCYVLATKLQVCVGIVGTPTVMSFSSFTGWKMPRRRHRRLAEDPLSPSACLPLRIPCRKTTSTGAPLSAPLGSVGTGCFCLASAWHPMIGVHGRRVPSRGPSRRGSWTLSMSADAEQLSVLGRDALVFLAATCAVVPA